MIAEVEVGQENCFRVETEVYQSCIEERRLPK